MLPHLVALCQSGCILVHEGLYTRAQALLQVQPFPGQEGHAGLTQQALPPVALHHKPGLKVPLEYVSICLVQDDHCQACCTVCIQHVYVRLSVSSRVHCVVSNTAKKKAQHCHAPETCPVHLLACDN